MISGVFTRGGCSLRSINMKTLLLLFTLSATFVAAENKITKKNLEEAKLFVGSESVSKVGLYCVDHGVTTATSMVLMNASKTKILAEIPIRSTSATDERHKNWLKVVWNPSGTMVAIQDSLDKHSKLLIFRQAMTGDFKRVDLPDLLKLEARGRLGLKLSTVISSGQEPEAWLSDGHLAVKYTFKTNNGKIYNPTHRIFIDKSGKYRGQ